MDLKPVISQLNLSDEFIKYYAYSVIKSQIPQVSRRAADNRLLHLIAFVAYQTFKLNDTLIDTLLNAVCNGLIKQDTLNGSIYTASRGVYESNKVHEKAELQFRI